MKGTTNIANLPNPGAYARAWRRLKDAKPGTRFNLPRDMWAHDNDRESLIRGFRAALDRRINTRGGCKCRGRKDDYQWEMSMRRAMHQVNEPRLIIDYLPQELHGRFGHRLRCNRDDL